MHINDLNNQLKELERGYASSRQRLRTARSIQHEEKERIELALIEDYKNKIALVKAQITIAQHSKSVR